MKIITLFVIYIVNQCATVTIRGIDNRCLQVIQGQNVDGIGLQMVNCNGSPAQDFEIDKVFNTIRLFKFTKCLDVGSTNNGSPVLSKSCTLNTSQRWDINSAGDIVNRASNKCLDVRQPAHQEGAFVQIFSCAGTSNQKWRIQ